MALVNLLLQFNFNYYICIIKINLLTTNTLNIMKESPNNDLPLLIIIIIILGLLLVASGTKRVNQEKAMEDLIDRIEQDLPNYVIDVLVETDEYQNYVESVN